MTGPRPSPSDRRQRSVALAVVLLVSPLIGACGSEGAPNVLLVSVDSLRRDHVSAYGYENPLAMGERTTPSFEALAREGVCFEDAVSTSSWTLPAHAALLTGLPDRLHGLTDPDQRLDGAHVTLAELFAGHGWRCGGFWSGVNLHPAYGFSQGFERYRDCSEVSVAIDRFDTEEPGPLRHAHVDSHSAVTSQRVVEESLSWIQEVCEDGDAPFFAFVHMWDPHYDYLPPAEFAKRFDPTYSGLAHGRDFMEPTQHWQGRDMQHLLSLYDAEIRYTDDHLGHLLEGLEALGVRENTLVVVTSDHGDEFYEHGKKGHQRTLYEEVVRVPMILSWPGVIPEGVRPTGQARIQDLYATLAELCALETPAWLEGASLAPQWEDPTRAGSPQPLMLRVPKKSIDLEGVRTERYKVVWDKSAETGVWYDLSSDPWERAPTVFDDLEAEDSEPVLLFRRMQAELEARSASVPQTEGHPGERLPASVVEELQRLGYL